jgi:hypothetical protein
MEDDVLIPARSAGLATAVVILALAFSAHWSERWLSRHSPPLPSWLPFLASCVIGFAAFVLAGVAVGPLLLD